MNRCLLLFLSVGQLCDDTGGISVSTPTEWLLSNDDTMISLFVAGSQSTYILLESGSVLACGRNEVGQLGDGTFDDSFGTLVSEANIVDLGAGPSAKSAFFLASDGKIFGTGLNNRGQLGVGDTMNKNVPVEVELIGDVNIDGGISSSISHTLAW